MLFAILSENAPAGFDGREALVHILLARFSDRARVGSKERVGVSAHLVSVPTAQEFVDRQLQGFAHDVPKGDINSRDSLDGGAAPPEVNRSHVYSVPEALDFEGISPDQNRLRPVKPRGSAARGSLDDGPHDVRLGFNVCVACDPGIRPDSDDSRETSSRMPLPPLAEIHIRARAPPESAPRLPLSSLALQSFSLFGTLFRIQEAPQFPFGPLGQSRRASLLSWTRRQDASLINAPERSARISRRGRE